MTVNSDDNNKPKPGDHNNAMGDALRIAQNWSQNKFDRNDDCKHDGILYRYGAANVNPEERAYTQIRKVAKRIEAILNNVALSIGGRATRHGDEDSCKGYDDFFEKGHREVCDFGSAILSIEVRFSLLGFLKLIISDVSPKAEDKPVDKMYATMSGMFRGNHIQFDSFVGLHYNPEKHFTNKPNLATLPGSEHFMSTLLSPIAAFAAANGLAFYPQGMATESLTYVFLDQEIPNAQ